jgi:leucyl aminopeptidase
MTILKRDNFDPTPSIKRSASVTVGVAKSVPTGDNCVGVPVGVDGTVPRELDLDRATLAALGFEGNVGQTLLVPSSR